MSNSKKNKGLVGKIVFRVITALLALTIIPAAIYLPLVKIVASTSLMEYGVGEEISISELGNYVKAEDIQKLFSGENEMTEAIKSLIAPLVCFAVFFILAMIMSLVVFGFALCSNMKKTILFESLGGVALMIAAIVSFSKAANLIIDGTVSVKELLGGGFLSGIISLFVDISTLHLASAPFIMIVSFVVIIAWTGAFLMTEIGEKK